MEFTPDKITKLEDNEIFVFGSNIQGKHGSGAAKDAIKLFGAVYGKGIGLHGKSYAIPTKNMDTNTPLRISVIREHVSAFLEFATNNPELKFYVTKIGCGLSKYKIDDIAPMFVRHPSNVILSKEFTDCINMVCQWGAWYE